MVVLMVTAFRLCQPFLRRETKKLRARSKFCLICSWVMSSGTEAGSSSRAPVISSTQRAQHLGRVARAVPVVPLDLDPRGVRAHDRPRHGVGHQALSRALRGVVGETGLEPVRAVKPEGF